MAGIYISYPFCAQKCTYCNFASGVLPRELEPRYLDRLRREIADTAFPWTPETIYWGGGTPSLIDGTEFSKIMSSIPGYPWREATIEASPGTITVDKARHWRAAGIDRVSLGVQSFVEPEIRRTGRKHDAVTVRRDVETLRESGIAKINIDLIAGLAGQTPESWRASLDALLRLSPDHASVYMLEVDEDSRLGKEMLLGGVRYGAFDVPDEGSIADFYESAVEALAQAGLRRYEISNFAFPGHESLHNLKYWQRELYFGFGADAHSFDGEWRWSNTASPREYVESDNPRLERILAVAAEERLFLGLRLSEGVPEAGIGATRSEDAGLLTRAGGRLKLTPRGVLLSNEVFEEFIS